MTKQNKIIYLYKTNIGIIVVAKYCPKLEDIFTAAGVLPKTYAAEFVESFYNYFFGQAIDLDKEYNCYYRDEYKDIFHYLYHKYCISPSSIKALTPALNAGKYIAYTRRTSGRNWPFQDYGETSEWSPLIIKAFDAEWVDIKNEN